MKKSSTPAFFQPEDNDDDELQSILDEIAQESTTTGASILTDEEELQVFEVDATLREKLEEYNGFKVLYERMLKPRQVGPLLFKSPVKMQRAATGEIYDATPTDIQNKLSEIRKDALRYIEFIAGKGKKLIDARQSAYAKDKFKLAFDYLVHFYGPNRKETLKVQMDYGIALLANREIEQGVNILLHFLNHLYAQQATWTDDDKKAVAIAHYLLAQHFYRQENITEAQTHLTRSQELRTQYGAPEVEMDRIRLFQAFLYNTEGRTEEALALLNACYAFRHSLEDNEGHLFPVLEALVQFKIAQGSPHEACQLLAEILSIQEKLNFEPRALIRTRLNILHILRHDVENHAFFTTMHAIKAQLDALEVNQENLTVGLSYADLAEIRVAVFLPYELPVETRATYYRETLAMITKARGHLNAAEEDTEKQQYQRKLKDLYLLCVNHLNFLNEEASLDSDDETIDATPASTASHSTTKTPTTKKDLMQLSDFSSELSDFVAAAEDSVLTIDALAELPDEGKINPYRLRAAQGGINKEFRDGQSLSELKDNLVAQPNFTDRVPPVEIGIYNNKVYSFDTRRLIVHQQAREQNPNVDIRYKKISGAYLQERIKAIFSPRPWNGYVTALRYGSKGSESQPYINPSVRDQLADTVEKDFMPFPHARQGANPNGFPIVKGQAKKIHAFLMAAKARGSQFSSDLLAECKNILNSQGQQAAYDFLISQKAPSGTLGNSP